MKLVIAILLSSFVVAGDGLVFFPQRVKHRCRKSFLVGAAGATLVGTVAAAGAAVAINSQINNNAAIYEPAAGSMEGQVVVITGGSSGLGLESAKRLAAAGATVVLTSRTAEKGEEAVESVMEYIKKKDGYLTAEVYNLVLDLDRLNNVKDFPQSFKQLDIGGIDVLMNNAGVMAIPEYQTTVDGYERTFQSNHLGHFALTAGLYPYLKREKSIVINVASTAYTFANNGLDLDNLNGEKGYGAWTSYGLSNGLSKLANILFTQELQRRAEEAGDTWLTSVALHPGVVGTDLGRYVVGEENWKRVKSKESTSLEALALEVANRFLKTAPEGANTQIFLAAGAEGRLKKGAYYDNFKEKQLPKFARDEGSARDLWNLSENLCNTTFLF